MYIIPGYFFINTPIQQWSLFERDYNLFVDTNDVYYT